MKKIITLLLLLTFCTDIFSQQRTEPYRKFTKADYIRKSRTQNVIGWVMVGCGVVCLITPSFNETPHNPNAGDPWFNNLFDSMDKTFSTISYVAGAAFVGGSVPLFIAANKNKKKAAAMAIVIKAETAEGFVQSRFPVKGFPSAGIRIVLR